MTTETHADGTLRSYVIGFVLSIVLTLASFGTVLYGGSIAPFGIVALALLQLFVQLVFFLHMGRGRESNYNLGIFMFTAVIIGILVGGTLWIMYNLAHLHMPLPTTDQLYQNGIVAPQNELN